MGHHTVVADTVSQGTCSRIVHEKLFAGYTTFTPSIPLTMLNCQKHLFDLDPAVHYINGAYMSPITRQAHALGVAAVGRKRNPFTIAPADFFSDVDQLKKQFARLVNAAEWQRVAIIPSVSYGIATIAQNLHLRAGQNIVVAEAQFPSNVYAWRVLAKDKQLTIHTIAYPVELQEGRGMNWNARILEAITPDTGLVALAHVHWANGTRFDLAAIGARCREVGAAFVIDGTQSVGALPFDVEAFGVDALVCGGYKWLMGPYALGYAYYGSRFDDGKPLEETWMGRRNARDFNGLVDYRDAYEPFSARYDMGEKSNFIHVPMASEALRQLLEWQPARIQAYCRALTEEAVAVWRQHGYWVEESEWRGAHLFGVQLPKGRSTDVLLKKLAEKRIFVSVRGEFVRISPNVYNDADDIAALTAVLTDDKVFIQP
jgi:selenocysteine lyase/cysteine desulfurase